MKNNKGLISLKKTFSEKINIPEIGSVLFVKSKKAKRISISIKPPDYIRVAIPTFVSIDKAIQFTLTKKRWIKRTIDKLLNRYKKQINIHSLDTNKGKIYLINRLEQLSKKYNLKYNKVTIRNQKTRWGSCSKHNNISLNIQLLILPDRLIDYVILHELVHTIVKNHSFKFWDTLSKYEPNAKSMDFELKQYYLI